MYINNINNISFGILNRSSIQKRPYGEYFEGSYKDYKIEVYDAYRDGRKFICVLDKFGMLFKCKLKYICNSFKK